MSEEDEGVEYCHAQSTWEWHLVAEEKDKERGKKEAKQAIVK